MGLIYLIRVLPSVISIGMAGFGFGVMEEPKEPPEDFSKASHEIKQFWAMKSAHTFPACGKKVEVKGLTASCNATEQYIQSLQDYSAKHLCQITSHDRIVDHLVATKIYFLRECKNERSTLHQIALRAKDLIAHGDHTAKAIGEKLNAVEFEPKVCTETVDTIRKSQSSISRATGELIGYLSAQEEKTKNRWQEMHARYTNNNGHLLLKIEILGLQQKIERGATGKDKQEFVRCKAILEKMGREFNCVRDEVARIRSDYKLMVEELTEQLKQRTAVLAPFTIEQGEACDRVKTVLTSINELDPLGKAHIEATTNIAARRVDAATGEFVTLPDSAGAEDLLGAELESKLVNIPFEPQSKDFSAFFAMSDKEIIETASANAAERVELLASRASLSAAVAVEDKHGNTIYRTIGSAFVARTKKSGPFIASSIHVTNEYTTDLRTVPGTDWDSAKVVLTKGIPDIAISLMDTNPVDHNGVSAYINTWALPRYGIQEANKLPGIMNGVIKTDEGILAYDENTERSYLLGDLVPGKDALPIASAADGFIPDFGTIVHTCGHRDTGQHRCFEGTVTAVYPVGGNVLAVGIDVPDDNFRTFKGHSGGPTILGDEVIGQNSFQTTLETGENILFFQPMRDTGTGIAGSPKSTISTYNRCYRQLAVGKNRFAPCTVWYDDMGKVAYVQFADEAPPMP